MSAAANLLFRPVTRNMGRTQLHHLLSCTRVVPNHFFLRTHPHSKFPRFVHFKSRGLKLPNPPAQFNFKDDGKSSDSESDSARSRNDKKRLAKRAVRWGMDLASFSNPQIKRILKVVEAEEEVYDAIMLVKRFGPDVREGKRRQFNLIGKLLRDVQPELMDALIQASKDGDYSRLQELSASVSQSVEDDDEEVEDSEPEEDDDEEESNICTEIASKWFDGLTNKDIGVTNEIYSIHSIEFDRQELRKLVRNVHYFQEQLNSMEGDNGLAVALTRAEKSLTQFLRSLARRLPDE